MTAKPGSPPRGAGLFTDSPPEPKPVAAYQANVDGGSRGNPGPAAYGVVIRDASGAVVARLKKYIGLSTNNVAEYYGLIAALDFAHSHGVRALRVESDSALMVNQLRGAYKVKSGDLKPLYERAKKMAQALESFRIEHVYREQNGEADELVNQALDETGRSGGSGAPEKASSRGNSLRMIGHCKSGRLELNAPINLPDGTQVEILVRVKK
ncbi:MAG TPA: ribonuclease HI family protein [Candidatus Eremiobacteraceae bacterium]|nr:ribonuclease HI family protein [Candidatus Eremiobacteraceae bacterium]